MSKHNENEVYHIGEVVWAKIRGYPYWPAMVSKISEELQDDNSIKTVLLVNFIGDNTHSNLTLDKIAKYNPHLREYTQQVKQKKLLDSVKSANLIISGITTYEDELKKFEKRKNKSQQPKNCILIETSDNISDIFSTIDQIQEKQLKDSKTLQTYFQATEQVNNCQDSSSEDSQCSEQIESMKTTRIKNQKNDRKMQNLIKPTNNKIEQKPIAVTKQITKTFPVLQRNLRTKLQESKTKNQVPLSKQSLMQSFQQILKQSLEMAEKGQYGDIFYYEVEINIILSSLINNQTNKFDIEENLNKLISKIHACCLNTDNVLQILQNNTSQSLLCIKELMEEKRTLLSSININVSSYVVELDNIVKMLKSQLIKKYFDFHEQFKQLKLILQPNKQKYKKELIKISNYQNSQKNTKNNNDTLDVDEEDNLNANILNQYNILDKEPGCLRTDWASQGLAVDLAKDLPENFAIQSTSTGQQKQQKLQIQEQVIYPLEQTDKNASYSIDFEIQSISNPSQQKQEVDSKIQVSDPALRKRVCQKMFKIIHDQNSFLKVKSIQNIIVKIEQKIRERDNLMQNFYKNKILTILKLMKFKLISIRELQDLSEQNEKFDQQFNEYKNRLFINSSNPCQNNNEIKNIESKNEHGEDSVFNYIQKQQQICDMQNENASTSQGPPRDLQGPDDQKYLKLINQNNIKNSNQQYIINKEIPIH